MEAPLQNLYCEIHQKRQVQFIDLSKDPEDKNRFYCSKCLMTRLNSNMKDSGLVDVQDLINKDPVQDIMNWPIIEDENLRKIQEKIQITDIKKEKQQVLQNFVRQFDEYIGKLISECDQIKEKTVIKIEQYYSRKEEDIKKYREETKLDSFYDRDKLINSFDNVNIIGRPIEEKNLNLDKYIQELNALEGQYIEKKGNLNQVSQDLLLPIQYQFKKRIDQAKQLFSNNIKQMKFMKKADILQQIPNKFPIYYNTEQDGELTSCIFPYRQKIKFETEFICQTPFKKNDDHFGFEIFECNKNTFSSNLVAQLYWYAKKGFTSSPELRYNNMENIKTFGDIYQGNSEKIQILFEICPQEGILIITDKNNNYFIGIEDNIFSKKQWGFRFLWNKQKQYSFNIKYIP